MRNEVFARLMDTMAKLGYEAPYIGELQASAMVKILACIEGLAAQVPVRPEASPMDINT